MPIQRNEDGTFTAVLTEDAVEFIYKCLNKNTDAITSTDAEIDTWGDFRDIHKTLYKERAAAKTNNK